MPRPIIYSINPTIIDRRRHNRSVWVTLNGANFNKEIFECAVINVDENLQYREAERTIVEHEISSNSTAKCLVDVSSIQLSHYLVAISTDRGHNWVVSNEVNNSYLSVRTLPEVMTTYPKN